MNITNYNPNQGLMIIAPTNSQKYTEKLDSYSQILTNIYSSNSASKFCIDSCWESKNIYYANSSEGYVKKISYDGTEISSLSLINPSMVSIIQYSNAMSTSITYPPQDDQGVWIVDSSTNKAIKTDNELNILYEANTSNVVSISASIDGGCYVVEELNGIGSLIKISGSGVVQSSKNYTQFSPSITKFKDIVEDGNGILWLCANDKIYKLRFYIL